MITDFFKDTLIHPGFSSDSTAGGGATLEFNERGEQ
jgi:hypothetical protein